MTRGRRWVVGFSAAAVICAVSLDVSGLASAQGSNTNNKVAGRVGNNSGAAGTASRVAGMGSTSVTVNHLTIGAAAFAPDGLHGTTEDYFNQWDPTTLSNQNDGRCFNTGVQLPNGAKLSSMTAYFTEGSTAMFIELNRQNLSNHTFIDLADFYTTSTTGTPTYTSMTVPITQKITVNSTFAYALGVCPNGTTTFSGVTINYTG